MGIMRKTADQWHMRNEEEASGIFSEQDRRVLWGSFGEFDLHAVWNTYFETREKCERLIQIRAIEALY